MEPIHINMIDNCPNCKASLIGRPIPDRRREHYKGTHWRREIGLYDVNKDKVTAWKCPDCLYEWERK